MYTVVASAKYGKSYVRIMRGGKVKPAAVDFVIGYLKRGEALPAICKDHQLKGDMSVYHECHIKHDLLLQYRRDEEAKLIVLVNIGTHQDLFGD
ncbi:type II toxin-antitoxin system YafQ family toxin [Candidatus Kaiserbacteria bacterium]|nr:type II toxin-antitoxin system YafQ family toxin [Candidatus Kaiserbacteria bacterium]